MKALAFNLGMLAGAFALMVGYGFLCIWLEPWLGEGSWTVVGIVLIAASSVALEIRIAQGKTRGWFDRPSPLPSFANGLPVTYELGGHVITIDDMAVHARSVGFAEAFWTNFTWLFKRSFDEPLEAYRCVHLSGTYDTIDGGEAPPGEQLHVRVELEHLRSSRTVLLGERIWGGLETIDDFSDHLVAPLRRLCREASEALGLPEHADGVLTRESLEERRGRSFW